VKNAKRAARRRPESDHPIAFLRGFLDRPLQVGSIVPSSRFLEKRIVQAAGLASARRVVELGPGTGGTTRAALHALGPSARLLAIEIRPDFAELLRRTIPDSRLRVHCASAADIGAALDEAGWEAPDAVLSGIPFSTIKPALGLEIVRAVYAALAPGGRFVAYQFRDRVEQLGRRVFGRPRVQVELLNVPPMRVYRWEKPLTRDLHLA
jgi:phospholipid N-methyltransferase